MKIQTLKFFRFVDLIPHSEYLSHSKAIALRYKAVLISRTYEDIVHKVLQPVNRYLHSDL